MQNSSNLGRNLTAVVLKFVLFALAVSTAFWVVFGTPDRLQKALSDSGVFDTVVDSVAEEAQNDPQVRTGLDESDAAKIKDAIQSALPKETVEQTVDQVITGVYAWLDGTNESLEFSVDLSQHSDALIQNLAKVAAEKNMSMPNCTARQLAALVPNPNPFEMTCKIPGTTEAQAQAVAENYLRNNVEFFKNPTFTVSNLPKDAQGRTIDQSLSFMPGMFQLAGLVPWILGIVAILLTVLVFYLSKDKLSALKSMGITFLVSGGFLLVTALIARFAMDRSSDPFSNLQAGAETGLAIVKGIRSLSTDFIGTLIKFAVIYLVIGAGLFVFVTIKRRSSGPSAGDEKSTDPTPPVDDSAPKVESPKPNESDQKESPKT